MKDVQREFHQRHAERRRALQRGRRSEARAEARRWALRYLTGRLCADCDEADPVVLEFDHRGDKEHDVARLIADGAPVELLEREAAKCDIRCANCHRRRTARERGYYRVSLSA